MRAIGRDPIFIERAAGAEIVDVDGNRYVDYVCSWGPLILGHAHPDVLAAVTRAAAGGTSFGAPTAAEVDLAEEVARRMPSVEMLRMTSSGTEATMSALRLARAATGRDTVVKFAGAYHGHVDGLLAEAGSGLATQGIPASPGVPEAATANTIVIGWNDGEALVRATEDRECAAVIAEPYPANMGLVPPVEGFLELMRERATRTGALLIFDEVISGFRVARGGAPGADGGHPRHHGDGQDPRRRAARGGLRRLARTDGAHRPGRRRLPGRHAVREPARGGGRAGHAGGARRARLRAPGVDHRGARRRPARGRRRPAGPGEHRDRPADRLLLRAPGARLRRRAGVRPRRVRRLVPGAAGAGCLRAALPVRGLVPVAGPHARARRAHARVGAGGVRARSQ